MARGKEANKNFEKVKKAKKETILIEIVPAVTVVSEKDGKNYINGFEYIETVKQYGKTYAKCYNNKVN